MFFVPWRWNNRLEQGTEFLGGLILFITQLLAMNGIAVAANLRLWRIFSMKVFPMVSMAVKVGRYLLYDGAYQLCEDSTDANQADGCEAMDLIKTEFMIATIKEVGNGLMLHEAADAWFMHMVYQLPEEEQAEFKDMHDDKKGGKKDMEMDDMDMFSLFSF